MPTLTQPMTTAITSAYLAFSPRASSVVHAHPSRMINYTDHLSRLMSYIILRIPALGRNQHGDGRRRPDRARHGHPGSDRHHARRLVFLARPAGRAMTWELFAVFIGSSIRLAAPLQTSQLPAIKYLHAIDRALPGL